MIICQEQLVPVDGKLW